MNYLYAILFLIIILSFWIIFSKSAVVNALCLAGIFLLSGICFLLLDAEFLALMLILVYGGAISILFLFIIMMLNLRLIEVYNVNLYYMPFYAFASFLFLFIYIYIFFHISNIFNFFFWEYSFQLINISNFINYKSNLHILGIAIYNYFYLYVVIAALILLIAMIGTIYLTLEANLKNFDSDKVNYFLKSKKISTLTYWKIKKNF